MQLSASLVLYNNNPDQFGKAMLSFLEGSDGQLVVIDNSPERLHHPLFQDPRVRYMFAGENLGFGRGHNRALSILAGESDYHLFLNPDIAFDEGVLPWLLEYMGQNPDIGALMPRIEYPDGSLQQLCKLLPTPVDLLLRRFIPVRGVQRRINTRYELHGLPQNEANVIPSLSGCFLLVRTGAVSEVGGFDERYFMYMEDVDLIRRIGDRWKTVYQPSVCVSHGYEKASYRNKTLMKAHIRSAFLYFSKWGWFFDKKRRRRNKDALAKVRQVPVYNR
jgi:GT2 family glycosyltransferase